MTSSVSGSVSLPVYAVREAGLVTITLNRADHRNALTRGMVTSLLAELTKAAADPDVRLVVLRAAGRDFCTGLDLDEFYADAEAPPDVHRAEARELAEVLTLLQRMPAPTVAAVAGRALGIGATLAAACDVVVASSGAQLGFPEVTLGFLPAFAAAILARSVAPKAAFELLATGRTIKADEARVLGLVSRVVPEEGWEAVMQAQIRNLCACALDTGPVLKELFRRVQGVSPEQAIDIAAEANARARASAAFREAAAEFRRMS